MNIQEFKNFISTHYENKEGYSLSKRYDESIYTTYGELLPEGVERLCHYIKPSQNDVFVDLGCGVGKVVLQFFLCTDVKKSIGVEAVDERYYKAASVQQHIPQNLHHTLQFEHMSILDFNFDESTIVLTNSVCFGDDLMGFITNQINSHSQIRAVITGKKMGVLEHLKTERIVHVDVSWNQTGVDWYLYTL